MAANLDFRPVDSKREVVETMVVTVSDLPALTVVCVDLVVVVVLSLVREEDWSLVGMPDALTLKLPMFMSHS